MAPDVLYQKSLGLADPAGARSAYELGIARRVVHGEQAQPCRPVSAQLVKLLEVLQPEAFQLGQEVAQCGLVVYGADGDQLALDLELVGREVESLVERRAGEAHPLEGSLEDEERRAVDGNRYGHH